MTAYDDLPDANSVVVSFRLSANDPRERRAMEYILRQHQESGLKKRTIIVNALLAAAENDRRLQQLIDIQSQSLDILQKLESGTLTVKSGDGGPGETGETLGENFKEGLRKLARPVVKFEEE